MLRLLQPLFHIMYYDSENGFILVVDCRK